MDDTTKPIHTLILDAAPIITNTPSASTLLAQSTKLLTVPSLVAEIQDRDARARFETTLRPFLELREPKAESFKVVVDFARKTGDFAVLSRTDIKILALAYEVECEKNGGDWRLRKVPGQKRLNGSPPEKKAEGTQETGTAGEDGLKDEQVLVQKDSEPTAETQEQADTSPPSRHVEVDDIEQQLGQTDLNKTDTSTASQSIEQSTPDETQGSSSESDSEGWITPSNLRKHQAADTSHTSPTNSSKEPRTLQVATLTTDFAMQNVLLQMNLNLLSPSLQRVRHIKNYILRCHACFSQVRDMSKQFCPRCGKPTLTRVSCSTNEKGEFKIHLKKNMQWNTRGDRFSIPKPVSASSSGKVKSGGGKGGWGQGLILAEDQKEYVKAVRREEWRKERDLMDEDYLPALLSGERRGQGGRPKVGVGRNINSKRQR